MRERSGMLSRKETRETSTAAFLTLHRIEKLIELTEGSSMVEIKDTISERLFEFDSLENPSPADRILSGENYDRVFLQYSDETVQEFLRNRNLIR